MIGENLDVSTIELEGDYKMQAKLFNVAELLEESLGTAIRSYD